GLMVLGAMTATLINLTTPLAIGGSRSSIHLQDILDQIVPGILPLGITFLVYYFVKKNTKTTWLLLGLMLLGFIGSITHIFT
ncbi:MAG TPA: PTS system mannose/fructose/sorbose family transporter subunit IID, partial [Chitinophagaceae bacterium]|nr:PTS system mannose/fructose/sorbose family transporter subunit IID [Chitinophagaceae bacterium]